MTEKRLTVAQFIKALVIATEPEDLTKFKGTQSILEIFKAIGVIQKRDVLGEIRPEYLEAIKDDARTEN